MSKTAVCNALSIDVEGFVEANQESFAIPGRYIDPPAENREIRANMESVLDLLEETGVFATFFFVGRLARDLPGLIRRTAAAGHEIGCHNFEHTRLPHQKTPGFVEKLKQAKADLEDVSGQAVIGFRAPDFSITQENIWMLDLLQELGFVYDSSIYPIGMHDVYGIQGADTRIHRLANGLIEVPMSTVNLMGKTLPFGGGGYFRLYPLWLTGQLIAWANRKGIPCISYIHPYEVGPVIPGITELSAYRKFRHYYNCKNGKTRLKKLLTRYPFDAVKNLIKGYAT